MDTLHERMADLADEAPTGGAPAAEFWGPWETRPSPPDLGTAPARRNSPPSRTSASPRKTGSTSPTSTAAPE